MSAYRVRIKVAGKWILGKASNGATLLNLATRNKVLRSAQSRKVPSYSTVVETRTTEQIIRDAVVANLDWAVNNEPSIHYPLHDVRTQQMPRDKSLPQTIDCSQFATWIDYLSGAKDPNGSGNYASGETMYTGSLLTGSNHITAGAAKPGDKIVYGGGTGHHVVTIRNVLGGGEFQVVSHGQEKGPFKILHTTEHAAQGGGTVTFLELRWQ